MKHRMHMGWDEGGGQETWEAPARSGLGCPTPLGARLSGFCDEDTMAVMLMTVMMMLPFPWSRLLSGGGMKLSAREVAWGGPGKPPHGAAWDAWVGWAVHFFLSAAMHMMGTGERRAFAALGRNLMTSTVCCA